MRRLSCLLIVPLAGLVLSACGTSVSTSKFKGASHEVAQTLANLQTHVTAAEEKKICSDDLATEVVTRLGGTKSCESAIKDQVAEIDSTTLTIESVHVDASGTTATAVVKSVYEGKKHNHTVTLRRQGTDWKISALQ